MDELHNLVTAVTGQPDDLDPYKEFCNMHLYESEETTKLPVLQAL